METKELKLNDIKKELMKTKVNATLSHYCHGNIYYNVNVFGETYQFPIETVETKYSNEPISSLPSIGILVLSTDLGTTSFYSEMRASELNRWIGKAFEKGDFVKIS